MYYDIIDGNNIASNSVASFGNIKINTISNPIQISYIHDIPADPEMIICLEHVYFSEMERYAYANNPPSYSIPMVVKYEKTSSNNTVRLTIRTDDPITLFFGKLMKNVTYYPLNLN